MLEEQLNRVRLQAEQSAREIRAAALMGIARVETVVAPAQARSTFLRALDEARLIRGSGGAELRHHTQVIAAAVAPDMVAALVAAHGNERHRGHIDLFLIGKTMLEHGHLDAAYDFVINYNDQSFSPAMLIGTVMHHLPDDERRLSLLRYGIERWRNRPKDLPGLYPQEDSHIIRIFAHRWTLLPEAEANAILHEFIDDALREPDHHISAGYPDSIHFTSARQNRLFELLHLIRRFDPALADQLISTRAELAAAVARYPEGLETMRKESEQAAEQAAKQAPIGARKRGYIMCGNPRDRDYMMSLIDSADTGDFTGPFQHAMEKYEQDSSPENPNLAPKEFWPSIQAFRSVLYRAVRQNPEQANQYLIQIADSDLRLLTEIEMLAAVAGLPEMQRVQMTKRNPDPKERMRRFDEFARTQQPIPMRSPDGRLIRCPACQWNPPDSVRWLCQCGHQWNTFWTSGRCPACQFQWAETACLRCGKMSPHTDWYVNG